MLTNDPRRLRLLGIDLHARTRRRIAVVLTYLCYFVAMVALDAFFDGKYSPWTEYLSMFALTSVVMQSGLFRNSGPVKPMQDRQSVYKNMVLLRGLDDWSRYLHGDVYDVLPPELQQDALLKYRVGAYMMPRSKQHRQYDPDLLDERELLERNRASTRALQIITTLLFSYAGVMINSAAHHRPPGDMPSAFMELALTAITLPKAIILWNEPDPRTLLEPEGESDDAAQPDSLLPR